MLNESERRERIERDGYVSEGERFRGDLASLRESYFRFSIGKDKKYALFSEDSLDIVNGKELLERAREVAEHKSKLFSIIMEVTKRQGVEEK